VIVAQRKPFDEIYAMLAKADKVLVAGCGGCVTVCLTGGEKAVAVLAGELELKDRLAGRKRTIAQKTITRQCDAEYIRELADDARSAGVVLSMACGVGVNYMTEVLDGPAVLPAMNTLFMGANLRQGEWGERCAGCGNCMLEKTGGICPVARCSKSFMNGPCGGTRNGKCEVNPDTDCAWALIVKRMERLGRLDELLEVMPPRDWSTARDGGPRRMTLPESLLEPEADTAAKK
jgi:ferredoxin